jgi:hypothetical protein
MNEGFQRKLKIENLTRCFNCSMFVTCEEPFKEDIVDCDHFSEIPTQKQVIVAKLIEWTGGKVDEC